MKIYLSTDRCATTTRCTTCNLQSSCLLHSSFPPLTIFAPLVAHPTRPHCSFFDFVPKHLRVGPWFFLSAPFVVAFAVAMYVLKPPLEFETSFPAPYSFYNVFDMVAAVNGVLVLWLIIGKVGPAPLCTYTIWSWCILTFRCASSAFCSFFPELRTLAWLSEFFRFPALVAASITFIVWNFVLAPIFYVLLLKTMQSKKNFLAWNTQV